MFLMMHSCFIYGYMVSDIWQMITQIMRENPLLPHNGLINSKGFLYIRHHIDRVVHTTTFVTPAVEHQLEK